MTQSHLPWRDQAAFAGTPLMLKHLPSDEEYRLAAAHIRAVAAEVGFRPNHTR